MFKALVDRAAALLSRTGTNAPAEDTDADERTAEEIIQAQLIAKYLGGASSELSPTSSVRAVAGSLPGTPAFPITPTTPATPERQQAATMPGSVAHLVSLLSRQTPPTPTPTPGGPNRDNPRLLGIRTRSRGQPFKPTTPKYPTSSYNTLQGVGRSIFTGSDYDSDEEIPSLRPVERVRDRLDKDVPSELKEEHPFRRGSVEYGRGLKMMPDPWGLKGADASVGPIAGGRPAEPVNLPPLPPDTPIDPPSGRRIASAAHRLRMDTSEAPEDGRWSPLFASQGASASSATTTPLIVADEIPNPPVAARRPRSIRGRMRRPQTSRPALLDPPDSFDTNATWTPAATPTPAPAAAGHGATVTNRPVRQDPYPPSRRGRARRIALIPSEAQVVQTARARRGAANTSAGTARETQRTGSQDEDQPSDGRHDWRSSDYDPEIEALFGRSDPDTTGLLAESPLPLPAAAGSTDNESQSPVRSPTSILRKRPADSHETVGGSGRKRVRWARD